jgi:hypothetical protein
MSICAQDIQRIRVKRIDARIDMAASYGFFLEADNFDTLGLHHAKWVLPFVYAHGHGSGSVVADMEIEQFTVVDIGNHITVGDHKRDIGSWIKQAQCAGRAQGGLLSQVINSYVQSLAIAKVIFNHLAQVMNG